MKSYFVVVLCVAIVGIALTTQEYARMDLVVNDVEDAHAPIGYGRRNSSCATDIDDTTYNLAYKQSFGFFTDVTEDHWKRLQHIHAMAFPNYLQQNKMEKYSNAINDIGNIPKIQRSNWWNGENFQVEFHCPFPQRIPSTSEADGPKWICDPHRLIGKSPSECLIYSFGSNGKAEFEHGIRQDVIGYDLDHSCDIHTFDMVTYNKRNGHFADALKGAATFHAWGLGTEPQARQQPNKFQTLQQTMDRLNHTGRTIDIFKIDCEWCEWHTFRQFLRQDIRQILVETHNAPMPHAKEFFEELHDAGYVIFSKEANYLNGAGAVEFAFVKVSTNFFVNETMYTKWNHKQAQQKI